MQCKSKLIFLNNWQLYTKYKIGVLKVASKNQRHRNDISNMIHHILSGSRAGHQLNLA